tara:strand:- start:262 stop:621 length:360 start_codon:yes stop_codon:yes gene_type:complete
MNYVYFSEGTVNAANTAMVMPAGHFMGIDFASNTTAKLYFRPVVEWGASSDNGDNNEEVLVTFPDVTTTGNINFAGICEILCGAINGSRPSGSMTVVADELNGNYISPLTGTVTLTAGG